MINKYFVIISRVVENLLLPIVFFSRPKSLSKQKTKNAFLHLPTSSIVRDKRFIELKKIIYWAEANSITLTEIGRLTFYNNLPDLDFGKLMEYYLVYVIIIANYWLYFQQA